MSIQKINTAAFLKLAQLHPVLDVRSPGEFTHAHIPQAIPFPLFSDEERKVVGTAYKQESKQIAIKIGLDYFGPKMRNMVEEAERILENDAKEKAIETDKTILVHCWRGGMRSGAVAWLLDLYGFTVYLLEEGYKAYRNWAIQQFEKEYNFKILGGYTGSGKTLLLHALANEGKAVVDLEALANHKGSALGALGLTAQPTQEMFENLLAESLFQKKSKNENDFIFIEDESQRIGNMQIPNSLWYTMRKSKLYFIDIPFEERLNYLTVEYGIHPTEKLVNSIIRIQKRLGGLETKNAINFLIENNHKESFRILLAYYDKWYKKGLFARDNAQDLITTIKAEVVDTATNIQLLRQNL
jgi:tRNA 2-selenouridine synthase